MRFEKLDESLKSLSLSFQNTSILNDAPSDSKKNLSAHLNINNSNKKSNSKYKKVRRSYEGVYDSSTELASSESSSTFVASELSNKLTDFSSVSSRHTKNKNRSSKKQLVYHKKALKNQNMNASNTRHYNRENRERLLEKGIKSFERKNGKMSALSINNSATPPEIKAVGSDQVSYVFYDVLQSSFNLFYFSILFFL